MKRLPVNIEHHRGEPAFSFASRLAAAMGIPSLRTFCRHMALPYDALARADWEAVERLAALGGADPANLRKHSLVWLDGCCEINGQKVAAKIPRGGILMGCPECLSEDVRQGSGPVPARAYLRTSWLLRTTRACPVHRLPLVDLSSGLDHAVSRDIAVLARRSPAMQCEPIRDREILPVSEFADYVEGRLLGGAGCSFLDGLPFHVAIAITEMVGASLMIGPRFDPSSLSDADWWKSGREGFAVTREGEGGLLAFLSPRLATFWETDRAAGGRALLGTLYTSLSARSADPDFADVCRIFREHAVDNLPIGPGDPFLGTVTRRRWHSVHSAALEYRVHPKRLRKQMAAEGFIKPGHERLTDDRTLFEAEPAAPFLTELSSSMSAEEASTYGGMPRTAWELLVAHGYIRPIAPASGDNGSYPVFSRADIDAFLSVLSSSATPMSRRSQPLRNRGDMIVIQTAAKKAKCSIVDVVRLLVEGKLDTVGYDLDCRGFRAVLVDLEEVRRQCARPGLKGLNLREVERRLGTTTFTVRSLLQSGHLEAETEINPVSRCPKTVVMPDVVAAFDERYVSLSRLARERRMQIAALKRDLDEAGIEPAFGLPEKAARFYCRQQPTVSQGGVSNVAAGSVILGLETQRSKAK